LPEDKIDCTLLTLNHTGANAEHSSTHQYMQSAVGYILTCQLLDDVPEAPCGQVQVEKLWAAATCHAQACQAA
jgi:hypothetical protein